MLKNAAHTWIIPSLTSNFADTLHSWKLWLHCSSLYNKQAVILKILKYFLTTYFLLDRRVGSKKEREQGKRNNKIKEAISFPHSLQHTTILFSQPREEMACGWYNSWSSVNYSVMVSVSLFGFLCNQKRKAIDLMPRKIPPNEDWMYWWGNSANIIHFSSCTSQKCSKLSYLKICGTWNSPDRFHAAPVLFLWSIGMNI